MRAHVLPAALTAIAISLAPAPAEAGPPERFSDTQTVLSCEALEGADGTAFVFAIESAADGSFGELVFWEAGATPDEDAPTWVSADPTVEFSDGSVTGSFPLFTWVEPTNEEEPAIGDPVGTATLEASLTPTGPPEAFDFKSSGGGNSNFRAEGTFQELAVSGTLSLPEGTSFDLSGCSAGQETFTEFSNAPASFVSQSAGFELSCEWFVEDTLVFLSAFVDEDFGLSTDLFIETPDSSLFAFSDSGTLTEDSFDASFELFDEAGTGPVGTAHASADLVAGDFFRDKLVFGNETVHVSGRAFAVAGTLAVDTPALALDLAMDEMSCSAVDVRVTEHFSARQGPRAKPLANEGPATAEPIAVGESVTVRTGGTDLEAEAACTIGAGEFEVPLGHTAWWSFEGTGGTVTVDTAGSDFDTVLGVYIDDGTGGLEQVGCVDDVDDGQEFSLQAAIDVATTAGQTYLVQAGGFGGEAGTLALAIR